MYKMLFALAVVALMASGAFAGEISQAALNDMGLSGMQQMSDDEGMAVRGKWALVWGQGTANVIGGTTETTGYAAGTDIFNVNGAAGANVAVAGTVGGGALFTPFGTFGFVAGQASLAAGGSIAGAF